MLIYSDPAREADPHALPNVEMFESAVYLCRACEGVSMFDECCKQCGSANIILLPPAWWHWSCSPGCLPDSDPVGPFDTLEEAITDVRENWAS